MQKSKAGMVFYVLIPLIIYECILLAGESVYMLIWLIPRLNMYFSAETGALDQIKMMQDLTDFAIRNGLMMQMVICIPSIIIFLYLILRDLPRRRFSFDISPVSITSWFMLIPLAAAVSVAGNLFLNIGNFATGSEQFSNATEMLNSGTLLVQILGIGFIIPICEEMVMRGLVYMRMRQYLDVNLSILLSSVIFALIHGNMVQGIFAFLLGIVLAWFYEKYGSLFAPILIHIIANLSAMGCEALMENIIPENGRDLFLFVVGMVFALIAAILAVYLNRTVQAKRIYADTV